MMNSVVGSESLDSDPLLEWVVLSSVAEDQLSRSEIRYTVSLQCVRSEIAVGQPRFVTIDQFVSPHYTKSSRRR